MNKEICIKPYESVGYSFADVRRRSRVSNLGAEGREFESRRPDQTTQGLAGISLQGLAPFGAAARPVPIAAVDGGL